MARCLSCGASVSDADYPVSSIFGRACSCGDPSVLEPADLSRLCRCHDSANEAYFRDHGLLPESPTEAPQTPVAAVSKPAPSRTRARGIER